MKQTYLFCLLFVSLFSNAQIINIIDWNLKNKLLASNSTNYIAKDLSDNYFKIDANSNNEIEINEAIQVSYLDIDGSNIFNLDVISNFSNLKHLSCTINSISNLDVSSLSNLVTLNCGSNNITNLNINNLLNLVTLNCYDNELTSLNTNGLTNLEYINCNYNPALSSITLNNLTSLTEFSCTNCSLTNLSIINSTNLSTLSCISNQLTNLDLSGLTGLKILSCGNNQFTNLSISNLPNLTDVYNTDGLLTNLTLNNLPNLKIVTASNCQMQNLNLGGLPLLENLNCSNNLLQSINANDFPTLIYLYCGNNQLSTLNISNLVNLSMLSCNNNQLTEISIQGLNSLWLLDFSNNQVSTFDANGMFNLSELYCSNNQLETLFLKNGYGIGALEMAGNPNLTYLCFDDLPNLADFFQWKINAANLNGICNLNSYCSFTDSNQFYTIQGQQKFDNENDGCDASDNSFPNLKYSITDGVIIGSIISNNTGNFELPVGTGQHTITPILENPNYFTVYPTSVVVDFPTQTSPATQNFCITPNGIKHDVEISIIPIGPARPGFDANYKIIYKNKGNQTENGSINLEFYDAVLDLVTTNPAFSSQTVNHLNWTYSNLQPFETREIEITFNVNSPMETPAVNANDFLIYTVEITQLGSDETLPDNSFGLKQIVVNSFDPNDKTCLQGNTITPSEVGKYVHYVIRFENTGTFPAQNIVVKDMIDTAKFDVSSLIPLSASHNYFTRIAGNKVEFIFENINLPFDDANNDGYITFKIKTLPNLVLGDTFSNSANIYFDYNFPIVTNTATTTIAVLNNPSFEFANYFSLYPNPTTNELNINLKKSVEINSIQIYNTLGQLVTVQTGNALKVDVSNLKTGNYFIKIKTNEGYSTSQFIKE